MTTAQTELQEMLQYYRVQKLLNAEARLLDEWCLQEWLELYTEDAHYYVPPTDVSAEEADPALHLYYIADSKDRMTERVVRLEKKTCHSEYPRSKVRHLVSNIHVDAENESGEIPVRANFVVYRSKNGATDMFMGEYIYSLVSAGDDLKIRRKTCSLALDGLRPQAKISIIL